MSAMIDELKITPSVPVTAKLQNEFYEKFNLHHTSAEFRMSSLSLFSRQQFWRRPPAYLLQYLQSNKNIYADKRGNSVSNWYQEDIPKVSFKCVTRSC